MICLTENCGHNDYDHEDRWWKDKCRKCDCTKFRTSGTGIFDKMAQAMGIRNKWLMVRTLSVDVTIILLLIYLAVLTIETTCVTGDIPLLKYNQCIAVQNTYPELFHTELPDLTTNIFNGTLK